MNPSTERKARAAAIYRKAAALCQRDSHASCFAVNEIVHGKGNHDQRCSASDSYAALFSPEDVVDSTHAWGERWAHDVDDQEWGVVIRKCRVLALLFMAAMVEAGDA